MALRDGERLTKPCAMIGYRSASDKAFLPVRDFTLIPQENGVLYAIDSSDLVHQHDVGFELSLRVYRPPLHIG